MSNVVITPNMSLTVPVTGQELGPDWANDINNSLSVVDGHTHSAGSGVQITPSGMNISSDLSWNNTNNAIDIRSSRFTAQSAALSGVSDLGCVYVTGVDLYYNDGNGNQIRITQSGSVAGSSGTITGLPSGTASAAYSSGSGTFVFQQATSTAANLDVGSVAIRYPGSYPTLSGNYILFEAPSSLSSAYSVTLPATAPGSSGAFYTMSTAGVLSYTNTDSSTLEISASTLQVKDSGISTAKIANAAVTNAKLAAANIVISASCSDYNVPLDSGPHQITNLTATITTSGRPVSISLIPDPQDSVPTGFFLSAAGNFIFVESGSTVIGYFKMTDSGAGFSWVSPSYVNLVDTPAAGTYTYSVKMGASASSGGAFHASYMKLCVYEL